MRSKLLAKHRRAGWILLQFLLLKERSTFEWQNFPKSHARTRNEMYVIGQEQTLRNSRRGKTPFQTFRFSPWSLQLQKSQQQPEYFLTENLKSLSSAKLIEKKNIFKIFFFSHFIMKHCSVILRKAL